MRVNKRGMVRFWIENPKVLKILLVQCTMPLKLNKDNRLPFLVCTHKLDIEN